MVVKIKLTTYVLAVGSVEYAAIEHATALHQSQAF